jgi:assimilatory nitrate reductase catalytic subunit
MNAQDMARRQLADGDLVHVTSKRGSILLPARASAEIGLSQACVAMHWGEEYLSGCSSTGTPLAGINALTSPVYCPTSKQPELKHTPVKILKAELPWSLLAMAWLPPETALAAHQALKPLMAMFPFATCVPFSGNTPGEERSGILFRAAAHDAPADELIDRIESLLGLRGSDALRYADRRRGQRRVARLVRRTDGNAGLEAFLLGGDTSAEAWIGTLLREEIPAQTYGRLLLSPGARAPVAVQSRGQTVCTCFNVTDLAIQAELGRCTGSPEERLASLQGALKCGTNCGSCLPELKRMVRATPAETVVEGA